jgi:tryptophan-rich sensory protein
MVWPANYAAIGVSAGSNHKSGAFFLQGTELWIFVLIWAVGLAFFGWSRYLAFRKRKKRSDVKDAFKNIP